MENEVSAFWLKSYDLVECFHEPCKLFVVETDDVRSDIIFVFVSSASKPCWAMHIPQTWEQTQYWGSPWDCYKDAHNHRTVIKRTGKGVVERQIGGMLEVIDGIY